MSDADPRDFRSLGDLLRDARQERKLNLEQVNESTKISVRVLRALEQDDLDAASGPIYARGFVRTLAKFYDLDPDWLGAKLDQLAGETSRPVLPVDDDGDVIAGPLADPEVDEAPEPTGPKWEVESTRVRRVGAKPERQIPRSAIIYSLVVVLVVAVALVWWLGRGQSDEPDTAFDRGDPVVESGLAAALPGSVTTSPDSAAADGQEAQFVVEDAPVRTPLGSVLERGPAGPATNPPEDVDATSPALAAAGSREEKTDTTTGRSRSASATDPSAELAGPGSAASGSEAADAESSDPEVAPPPEPQPVVAGDLVDPEGESVDPKLDAADDLVSRRPGRSRAASTESGEDPAAETGLPSVVRPSAEDDAVRMELVVQAEGPVEVTLSVDGERAQTRRLGAGDTWRVEGTDHFSVAVSDPSLVALEMDGRPRALPGNWAGDEWILYPVRSDGGG